MKVRLLCLSLGLAACTAPPTQPATPVVCVGDPDPARYALVLATGDTGAEVPNAYMEPRRTADTQWIALKGGQLVPLIRNHYPGECFTVLDSIFELTPHVGIAGFAP